MTPKQLLDQADLSAAIAKTTEALKNDPANVQNRTFLFELLCFAGDLERAVKQLDALARGDTEAEIAVSRYRSALEAEKLRRQLYTEGRTPGLPKDVPAYTQHHLQAIAKVREGRAEEARALLEQAFEQRPAVACSINGETFDDIRDADDLLAPFLEIFTVNNYSWVPWEAVKSVTIEPPKHLRDLMWMPATVELQIGMLGEVFLPALYAQSYQHADNQVKLGRVTDWRSDLEGLALASGQKMLVAGDRDWPFLEIRQLECERPEQADGNAGAGN